MSAELPIAAPPSHGFTVVNDLRLHYLDFGGSGKLVIFLHGVTSHAWVWRDAIPQLAQRRLIALDSRGHGDSQWSIREEYATEDLASDVIEFIREIATGSVDIVGASWGGLVGLNVATRVPDLVDSLTLVDIPPSFPGPATEVHIHPASFSDHAESIAYVRNGSPTQAEAFVDAVAALGVRPGSNGRLYVKHDDFFHENRPHRTVDYWADLQSLRVPILIVRADGSTHPMLSVADKMLSVTHDGELVTISETGHRISTDNPVALKVVLRGFLEP